MEPDKPLVERGHLSETTLLQRAQWLHEVKNRRGTTASQPMKKGVHLFGDHPEKPFRPSGYNEINVLAITAYHAGNISPQEEQQLVENFLADTDVAAVIDAVALHVTGHGSYERLYFPKNRPLDKKDPILRSLFKPETIEDHSRVALRRFPLNPHAAVAPHLLQCPELHPNTELTPTRLTIFRTEGGIKDRHTNTWIFLRTSATWFSTVFDASTRSRQTSSHPRDRGQVHRGAQLPPRGTWHHALALGCRHRTDCKRGFQCRTWGAGIGAHGRAVDHQATRQPNPGRGVCPRRPGSRQNAGRADRICRGGGPRRAIRHRPTAQSPPSRLPAFPPRTAACPGRPPTGSPTPTRGITEAGRTGRRR